MVDLEQDLGHSLLILESAPIGMCISDLKGNLIRVNSSFCEILGFEKHELEGVSFKSFTYKEDLAENTANNHKLISGEIHSYTMEKRYISKHGKLLNAIMRVTTLPNQKGEIAYLLAQVIDISEKVNLIEQLTKSEAEFREIFEEAAFAIAKTDLNQNIISANPAMCDMLEYEPSELIGMNVSEISHPDEFVVNQTRSQNLISKDQGNYSMEKRYITKTGKILHGLLKVSFLKGSGTEPSYLLGQIVDISSIKEMEHLLKKQNNELQKVNFELDSFIYKASHDLKGPLASLKGLINVYKQGDHDDEILTGMTSSIQRLENTIRELIEFSENSQKSDLVSANIFSLIDDCISVISHHPKVQSTTMNVDVDPELDVRCDSRRLKSIIINLLLNAVIYQDTTKDSIVEIHVSSESDLLVISVTDNGIGMDEKVIERAFDMFYRGSELSVGNGLGLYLVRESVNKMDGSIAIESSEGKGTKVNVSIPLQTS